MKTVEIFSNITILFFLQGCLSTKIHNRHNFSEFPFSNLNIPFLRENLSSSKVVPTLLCQTDWSLTPLKKLVTDNIKNIYIKHIWTTGLGQNKGRYCKVSSLWQCRTVDNKKEYKNRANMYVIHSQRPQTPVATSSFSVHMNFRWSRKKQINSSSSHMFISKIKSRKDSFATHEGFNFLSMRKDD